MDVFFKDSVERILEAFGSKALHINKGKSYSLKENYSKCSMFLESCMFYDLQLTEETRNAINIFVTNYPNFESKYITPDVKNKDELYEWFIDTCKDFRTVAITLLGVNYIKYRSLRIIKEGFELITDPDNMEYKMTLKQIANL